MTKYLKILRKCLIHWIRLAEEDTKEMQNHH